MENDAIEEYKSSLSDLNCNSKPMINALTIIAEENIKFASQIVQVIENHINEAVADLKLPVLYLIDSIMKNVGRDYLSLFSERIVAIFTSVFEKVDEKTRLLLYKLRQTWTEIIPNIKLFAIDISVHHMDPAWPVTSQAPVTSIHINPKFLTPSPKKPEELVAKETETKFRERQEVVEHLVKQKMWRMNEETKEAEKRTSTNVHKPTVVHVHPSEDVPSTERSVTQKLDPRTVQRDPRLQKSGASTVALKGFPEDKSVKNVSTVLKNQQSSLQKHSSLPSAVLVPSSNFSQTREVDFGATSKNDRKSENSYDSSKKKKSSAEGKNFIGEQTKHEESKSDSVKRFPSPQKLNSELQLTEIQDKTQRGQDSSNKTRLDGSPSKNKSLVVKEKQLNTDSKQLTNSKSSDTEKTKTDIKDSHVETVKLTVRPSKGSPKHLSEAEKESETYNSRNRNRAATAEDRRPSPRQRSRSPLHGEDKKKDNKPKKIPSRSSRHLPMEKADIEKVESSQEPAAAIKDIPSNDFPKVDTDLRVSARSSVSPEKNSKSCKRDNSAFRENENQGSLNEPLEPPVKKVKDEKENKNSESDVSWFGNQDQDYRCKERENKINDHQGWAQYKAIHPDEFKSPLRPARENMENIVPDREVNDKLLPKHAQPERYLFDRSGEPETEYDKLGRPRLHRRRSSEIRFRGRRGRRYEPPPQQENFYYGHTDKGYDVSMLSNPQFIIRQAEERFRAGVINEDCFRDIRDGLQKMLDSARRLGFRMPNFDISPMHHHHKFYEEDEFPGSRMRQMNKVHSLTPPLHVPLRTKGPKPAPPSTRSFELDHVKRDIHFVDDKAIVVTDGVPKQIILKGQPTQVFIEGMDPITVKFDGKPVRFEVNGKMHMMRFGVPTRELYIDDYPYEGKFGGPSFVVDIDDKPYSVNLGKPVPDVIFLDEPQPELYKNFVAGTVRTEPSNARMSPIGEKDIKMEEKSGITKFPIGMEDSDFRSTENEKKVSNAASASGGVPFDVDMRTPVTVKKEPEECERSKKFDNSEYAEISGNRTMSDMKDVDWRHHPSSMDFAPPKRDNSLYAPNVDFLTAKDSQRPADAPPDSVLQPSLPRNQVIKSDGEPNFRNVFADSNPQAQNNIWNGPISHDTLGDRTRNSSEKQEWENNQGRTVTWQENDPRHSQLSVQPHDRPPHDRLLPCVPSMQGKVWGGSRFPPPYSQNESTDRVLQPRVIAPQQSNWRQPLENLSDGNPNIPGWEWKPRGFRPDVPVPTVRSHPPEQGHRYNMQRNELKPPFENYRGPYDQLLPPPPLPPRAPLCLMGNQLRPEIPPVPMLRPPIPNCDLRNSRPPPPPQHQRSWLPRNPLESMPPPVREHHLLNFPHPLPSMSGPHVNPQLRTTLPPPPFPPSFPNIPISLQGTVPFGLPRVPSPVVSEMSSVEPVTSQGHVPPYTVPAVQIKSDIVDTSSSQASVQTSSVGPQPSTSQETQQPTTQASSVNVPPSNTGPPVTSEVTPSCSTTPPNFVDLSTLLERLVAAGIIPNKPAQAEKMEVVEPDVKNENESMVKEEPTPPIEFSAESLKGRYSGVISALFRGTQCASCGMRFKDTHGERYSRHLDWHFRVNRREKDGAKKAFSRKWYYDVEDWVQFEEFEDFEERARSFFELQADEELLQAPAAVEVPTVQATCGNETEVCVNCRETFQLLWLEEEEEWHLKDAVRGEDGQPYHPFCFEDFKKASEVPDTPVSEVPPVDTTSADMEQEEADKDKTSSAEDTVLKDGDMTENGDAEEVKEMDDVSEKPENAEESSAVEEEETVEVKEELMEDEPLEGKPGEEEIIGVITESDLEEEERKEPPKESKMVVLQSGGIVMKVRAESIQPASPAPAAPPDKDADQKKEEEESEDEFRPPTPDPRFKVLPPVKKGTELSGLCSIM